MKLRVYVAGASKDLERAERAMTWLREAGCEITTDWVAEMKAEPLADRELTLERQQRCATADLLGVIRADVVWFLVPSEPVRSSFASRHRAPGLSPRVGLPPASTSSSRSWKSSLAKPFSKPTLPPSIGS
jgi:hypothetical protein